MDESFVLLGGASSYLRQAPGSASQPTESADTSLFVDHHLSVLERTFEIASGETRVRHVSCCAGSVLEARLPRETFLGGTY
jgi:hypothetical protein